MKLWRTTAQSIGTSAWTKITFDSLALSQQGVWVASADVAVSESGVWMAIAKVKWDTNATNERRIAVWSSASGTFPNGLFGEVNSTSLSANGTDQTTTAVFNVISNTTVALAVWQNSGVNVNVTGEASYGGYTTLDVIKIA